MTSISTRGMLRLKPNAGRDRPLKTIPKIQDRPLLFHSLRNKANHLTGDDGPNLVGEK